MKDRLFSKSRLIAIISFLLVFSFTFTSFISYNVTRETITRGSKTETLPLISDNIYSEIQQILINPISNSSLMANDAFLIDWVLSGENDSTKVVKYLKRIKEKYGYFSTFFVSESTGNYYYYDGILKKISVTDTHDIWYYYFVNKNIPYELDVDTDQASAGTLTIFINHRLEDQQGNFLGVTGVGLKMESIGQTLSEYQNKYNHNIYMINSEGLIQVHPDINLVEKVNIRDLEGIGEQSDNILSTKLGTNIYEYKSQNKDIIISSRYFPDLKWFLIVESDQGESLLLARNYLLGNIVIGIVITLLIILLVVLSINAYHKKIESMAINDELTGLFNRRKIQEVFQKEIAFAHRYETPLSVMMIDIDGFKSINDVYGHQAGDKYLKSISESLKGGMREIDTIGRWGGDEFIVILHNADSQTAALAAKRLLNLGSFLEVRLDHIKFSLTLSIGVGTFRGSELEMDQMIALADEALYKAKVEGRNQVCSKGT